MGVCVQPVSVMCVSVNCACLPRVCRDPTDVCVCVCVKAQCLMCQCAHTDVAHVVFLSAPRDTGHAHFKDTQFTRHHTHTHTHRTAHRHFAHRHTVWESLVTHLLTTWETLVVHLHIHTCTHILHSYTWLHIYHTITHFTHAGTWTAHAHLIWRSYVHSHVLHTSAWHTQRITSYTDNDTRH